MTQANAICIKWGAAYGPEYVNRLYSGVRRNLSVPVRFYCMTENHGGLHPDINVLELPDEPFQNEMNAALVQTRRQGAMRKVSLFRPGLIPDLDGPLLGFDLDVVITGSLDRLMDFEPGKVIMRHDWLEARQGHTAGHGSVFRFDPRLHSWLYSTFAKNPRKEVEKAWGSEQWYTSMLAQERGAFAYIPPEWVASFRYDCWREPPSNLFREPRLPGKAMVVCFHGEPKMPEAILGYRKQRRSLRSRSRPCAWVKEHWIDRAAADLGSDWA